MVAAVAATEALAHFLVPGAMVAREMQFDHGKAPRSEDP
jgi:hypothetical protein